MKKLLFLAILLTAASTMSADTVDREQARTTAEELLGKRVAEVAAGRSMGTDREQPAYYVFNAEDGKGFAIVSAESEADGVLGYSPDHAFPEGKTAPCALQLYLNTFSSYVTALRSGAAEVAAEAQLPTRSDDQPFLLTTTWGQNAPYYNLCPMKDDKHCLTGCVATATAQLLYYWRWPVQGTGYNWAKDGRGEVVHGSLEHVYDWDAMRDKTHENLASEEAATAVAQLMYDCGLSVNMNYNIDGSGARTPIKALHTHFGYQPAPMRIHYRECYEESEWRAIIQNELAHRRPIYHTAASPTGGGQDAVGHAFVIDGYDDYGRIHINWGWDGDYNGFFDLSRMNPGRYDFTLNQTILTGIEPAKNGETGEPVEYMLMRNAPRCNTTGSTLKTSSFIITVGNIQNPNANAHTWQLTIGIFDTTNKMLGEVKTGRIPNVSLDPGYAYPSDYGNITCKVNGNYAEGDYALRVLFRDQGTTEWRLPDMNGGLKNNAVYIRIAGNRVYFTDGTDYLKAFNTAGVAPVTVDSHSGDGRIYDLQGREVKHPGKGIYIRNGKKSF